MELKEYLLQQYSKTTLATNTNNIRRYVAYMHDKAETATYNDVLDYIGYLRKKGTHSKTLRNNLFAIKIYYRYLISIGKRKDHPCSELNLQDKINKAIPVESLYSITTLENFLQTHKSKRKQLQKRDEIIICFLIYQALTVLEISQIDLQNINLDKGEIYIKGNVKQKKRTLLLKPQQIMLLHKYITEERNELLSYNRNPSQADKEVLLLGQQGEKMLQNSISRIVNYNRPPQERLLPMKIRQSVIAHLLKQGNNLRIVQVFAGHRRAGSTEEYKQTGLEALKNAVSQYHPLQ
jgi:integrase/recombinase XerD